MAQPGVRRILEVGCGTGHWLELASDTPARAYGVDLSLGMLRQGRGRAALLTQADACALPLSSGAFDLVYCVNALHHFGDPAAFVVEAHRVLVADGRLAAIGSVPHGKRASWYGYEYFDGAWERDIARVPSWSQVASWTASAGFGVAEVSVVETVHDPKAGRDVLSDPFLSKTSCSQLALLSDDEYARGIERIRATVDAAEARRETATFETDLIVEMLVTRKVAT